jgi:hypothetical protein
MLFLWNRIPIPLFSTTPTTLLTAQDSYSARFSVCLFAILRTPPTDKSTGKSAGYSEAQGVPRLPLHGPRANSVCKNVSKTSSQYHTHERTREGGPRDLALATARYCDLYSEQSDKEAGDDSQPDWWHGKPVGENSSPEQLNNQGETGCSHSPTEEEG